MTRLVIVRVALAWATKMQAMPNDTKNLQERSWSIWKQTLWQS